jgi:hypothetical protein
MEMGHHNFGSVTGDVITIKKENPVKLVYVKDVPDRIGR